MMVTQPAGDAYLVVVLSTGGRSAAVTIADDPQVAEGSTEDRWTIRVPLASGLLTLSRADGEITFERAVHGLAGTVRLTAAPDATLEVAAIRDAFDDVAAEYPQFQSRMAARIKVTKFLAALVIGQELSLHLVRHGRSKHSMPIRVLSILCWVMVGAWLQSYALRSRAVLRARDS